MSYDQKACFLLHLNGAVGSITITDTGLNAATFTNNSCIISNEATIFNDTCLMINKGGYLSTPYVDTVTTDDFTIETWVNFISLPTAKSTWPNDQGNHAVLMGFGTNGSADGFGLVLNNTKLMLYASPSVGTYSILGSVAHRFTVGSWYHVAASCVGKVLYLFINGVLMSKTSMAFGVTRNLVAPYESAAFPARCTIGADPHNLAQGFLNAYLSEARYIRGYGMYSAAFTPSTTRFADYTYSQEGLQAGAGVQHNSTSTSVVGGKALAAYRIARNYYQSGSGSIAGQTVVNGTPVSRRVRLYHKLNGTLVAETYSNDNGAYRFTQVDETLEYYVVADDYTRTLNAVIADGIKPLASTYTTGVISGKTTGAVTDKSVVFASGFISVAGTDSRADKFALQVTTSQYGTFNLQRDGHWTYKLNMSSPAVMGLAAGATTTDTFTAVTVAGATCAIVLTITGTNDVPVITGATSGTVAPGSNITTITGNIGIIDPDVGQSMFTAETIVGTYGSLTINASGVWTYTSDTTNTAVVALAYGSTLTDTINVRSSDLSKSQPITITLTGTARATDALSTTAVAMYSLRKVRGAYTGAAINVRRDSDNAVKDIGFTIHGDLDTASLLAFVGAGNGYVVTWYDQSTSALHATANTVANQPLIVRAGALVTMGTRPAIKASSSCLLTQAQSVLASGDAALTVMGVLQSRQSTNNDWFSYGATTNGAARAIGINNGYAQLISFGNDYVTTKAVLSDAFVQTSIFASSTLTAYFNSSLIGSQSGVVMATPSNTSLRLLDWLDRNDNFSFNGYISEVIIFNAALGDTERRTLEYDAGEYYDVYANAYSNAVLADSPTSYLRFSEETGTVAYDSSANAKHAAYNQDVSLMSSTGLLDGALNKGITATSVACGLTYKTPPITTNGAWSAEAIIQPIAATSDVGSIYQLGSTGNGCPELQIQDYGSGMFGIRVMASGTSELFRSATSFAYGTRVHLVLTHSGTAIKLYLNGVLDANSSSSAYGSFTGTARVGFASFGSNGYALNSKLDELAFYQTALTQGQVTKHYSAMSSIFGGDQAGSIIEDGTTVSGRLLLAGPDSKTQIIVPQTMTSSYGSLVISGNGAWVYTLNNSTLVQSLPAASTVQDSFTITSTSGKTGTLVVTITGTNDTPTIYGTASGTVNIGKTATLSSAFAAADLYKYVVQACKPVAYYRLNETSGTVAADSSGNGKNGVYGADASTVTTTGLLDTTTDTAVNVTSVASGVTITANPLTTNTAWTIEAVIKPTAIATSGGTGTLLQLGAGGAGCPEVEVQDYGSSTFGIRVMSSGTSEIFRSATSFAYGTRVHLVLIYNGTTLQLYLNGKLDANSGTYTYGSFTGASRIGYALFGSAGYPFNGTIDEVAFYQAALTQVQVLQHNKAVTTALAENVTGKLSIFDKDTGESSFVPTASYGSYGVFCGLASGDWLYIPNTSDVNLTSLAGVSNVSESFSMVSYDKSVTKPVVITIVGQADLYSNNIVSQLHFEGTNGASVFTDDVANTWNGGGRISTSTKAFGTSSGYFPGGTICPIYTADAAQWRFGTGDFTIEGWFLPAAPITATGIVFIKGMNTTDGISIGITPTLLTFRCNGTTDTTVAVNITTWSHIAFVRSSGTLLIFVNGVQVLSQALSFNHTSTATVYLGSNSTSGGNSDYSYAGYIDEVRVTKGIARYTSGFTPQSTAFVQPVDAYRSDVIFESEFESLTGSTDPSGIVAITTGGTIALSTAQAVTGKSSLYTAGTGYLSTNVAFPKSSAFTVEAWIYPLALTGNHEILGWWSNDSTGSLRFLVNSSGQLVANAYDISNTLYTVSSSNRSIATGAWYHVAAIKNSSCVGVFINGKFVAFVSCGDLRASADKLQIGRNEDCNTWYFNGYIDNVRVTANARYPFYAFTPNTAPFPQKVTAATSGVVKVDYKTTVSNDSPIAYWPLAYGNLTDTTGSKTLTAIGNPSQASYTDPTGQNVYRLNGTSQLMKIMDSTLLTGGPGAKHTIEAIVYNEKATITGNALLEIIAGKFTTAASPYPCYGMFAGLNNGTYDSSSYTAATTMYSYDMASMQPAAFSGKWYHVAAVFDNTSVTIYVNGESVTRIVTNLVAMPTTSPFEIGGRSADMIQFFYGAISHVAVYNTALSAAQVRSHATASGIVS